VSLCEECRIYPFIPKFTRPTACRVVHATRSLPTPCVELLPFLPSTPYTPLARSLLHKPSLWSLPHMYSLKSPFVPYPTCTPFAPYSPFTPFSPYPLCTPFASYPLPLPMRHQSACVINLGIHLFIFVSDCSRSVCLSCRLPACSLSVCISVCLPVCLSCRLPVCLSVCLYLCLLACLHAGLHAFLFGKVTKYCVFLYEKELEHLNQFYSYFCISS